MIVADESADYDLVLKLRAAGIEVLSIQEKHAGSSDVFVLATANELNALLITEDKDFGELIFYRKRPHSGTLLIRINKTEHPNKVDHSFSIIMANLPKLEGNFSVLTISKFRISKSK